MELVAGVWGSNTVIDARKAFDVRYAEKADKTKRLYTADDTHLNATGNAIFAKTVLENVKAKGEK